jgi:hypothetical protein
MTQLKDGGRQPGNREERSLSASTVIARWQGNGWDEPCKSRGLRTVLWAAGGEIPPADPAAWNPCLGKVESHWPDLRGGFEFTRALVAKCGMPPNGIIEAVDVAAKGDLGLCPRSKDRSPQQFRFHCLENKFRPWRYHNSSPGRSSK